MHFASEKTQNMWTKHSFCSEPQFRFFCQGPLGWWVPMPDLSIMA